jgi:TRAP-type C4-dicarboxylate transport system permease small subunit
MWLERFSNQIDKLTRWLAIRLLGIMFLIVLFTASFRYLFRISFVGAYDWSRVLFVWCIFLGVSIVYRQQAHSKFVFIESCMKGTLALINSLILNLLSTGFFIVVIYTGIKLCYSARIQKLPASGISALWLYLPIVIGSVIILLHSLVFLCQDIKRALGRNDSSIKA